MDRLTRRTLLASPAALAAAAAQNRRTIVKLPQKVRVGVLGLDGHVGEVTSPLGVLPDVEIVAVSDRDKAAVDRFLKNPRTAKARAYSDYRDMLDKESLDLVAVCNNNGDRAEAIRSCALRRLHVFAEKPVGISRAEVQSVREVLEQTGVKMGQILPMRFEAPYLALRKAVDDGLVGEVLQIASQKSYKAGKRPDWFLKRSTYGSTILWIGIHMIDLMRFTSGREFAQVFGYQTHLKFPELGEMDNVTASVFKLDNGGLATLRMDYLRPATATTHGDDRLRLAGTKGVVEYQAATGVTLLSESRPPGQLPLPEPQWAFVDFLESTYLGRPARLTMRDIWQANEVTLAAHEAAESGVAVKIEQG